MLKNRFVAVCFCIIFILFWTCKSEEHTISDQSELVTITLKDAEQIKMSTLFDNLSYVVLDDEKDISLLKSVDKMEVCDSLMFLLDKTNNKLHCFDLEGIYLNTIGCVGNGPGEYVKISDFAIDHADHTIVILDRNSRKIVVYSLDGNFINSHAIGMMAESVSAYGDKYVFYTSGSDYYTSNKDELGYNLFITDKKCNILSKMFKYNPNCENIMKDRPFDFNWKDSTLLFHYAIYDTIYKMASDGKMIKYVVDFGEQKVPIAKVNEENYKYYLNKDGYSIISKVCHSDNYMFINYAFNNRIRCIITDNKGKCIANSSMMKNDIDDTLFALFCPLKVIDNRAYFIRSSSDLLFDHKKDSLWIKNKCLTAESNPVIIIGYLK